MDHEFLITMRLSFSLAFITTLILLPIGIFLGYFLSLKCNLLTSLTETLVYMPYSFTPKRARVLSSFNFFAFFFFGSVFTRCVKCETCF